MNPTVSFVVPCYKLSHLLADCVSSILAQTYGDFEILIMDDCSPDDTPDVAQSFRDSRVKHVRNEVNLGHLRNYNKGISLARGKYIWLISADDCIRCKYALERYVRVLDSEPSAGYVFCPGVRLENGKEGEVLGYSLYGRRDKLIDGRQLVKRLVCANFIVAPSVLVRKECYEKISMFPLDMPWAGDWYLWCVFALYYDVAYVAEPMVYYRRHTLSMTNSLTHNSLDVCASEDISMPWLIRKQAMAKGYSWLNKPCLAAAAGEYAKELTSKPYRTATCDRASSLTYDAFERSLSENASNAAEAIWVRALTFSMVADQYFRRSDFSVARVFYKRSLQANPWLSRVWIKMFMLSAGKQGLLFRRQISVIRRTLNWG